MARLILVFVVYVLAPILIIWWAVKRYKSGVKPDFIEVVAVVLSIVLIGLLSFTLWSTVTDEDREDAQRIVQELTQRYSFPVKAKFQEDKPAVFGDAEGRNIVVTIYGVTDSIEQQKIVAIAEKLREQWDSKPIIVKFYQKEIWEQTEQGARRPAREKEMLIHKYHIE
jgi:hypothetical protein